MFRDGKGGFGGADKKMAWAGPEQVEKKTGIEIDVGCRGKYGGYKEGTREERKAEGGGNR